MPRARLALPLTLPLLLLALAGSAAAGYHKYVDRNGVVVFVDDESKVPPEYRKGLTTYQDEIDRLPPEERAAALEERQRKRREQDEVDRLRREEAARAKELQSLMTPVVIRGNQVLVPVEISYRGRRASLSLLLDTGASSTVLYHTAVEKLSFERGEQGVAQLAGGHMVATLKVRLSSLKVGPLELPDWPAVILEQRGPGSGFDGLLGMDVLRRRHYQIDYQQQLLLWQP